MSSRTILLTSLAVLIALAAVPAASAQASGTFTIEIQGVSEAGPTLAPGAGPHTMAADIAISGTGFVCPSEATIDVLIEPVGHAPDMGFLGSVAPATLTFTIPAGAYLAETSTSWSPVSQPVDFTMEVAEDAMKGHDSYGFGLKALYDGTAPAGCQSQGWSGAEDQVLHTISVDYPTEASDATDATENATEDAAGSAADVEESPGVGPVFLGVVAVAGLLAGRRRGQA